jgi:hypothetical protein
MVSYLRIFLYVLRAAAAIGLLISSIITLVVLLDLSFKLGFGYPWWTVFIVIPIVMFFIFVMRGANTALKSVRP